MSSPVTCDICTRWMDGDCQYCDHGMNDISLDLEDEEVEDND